MDSSKSPFDPDPLGKSESATGDASSATAIFGTVPAKPTQSQEDILKSLLGNQSASSPAPAETPSTPVTSPAETALPAPASSPGGFTDMFEALQKPAGIASNPPAPAATPAPVTTPSAPTPQRPTDLSGVFTQVVVEKTNFSPPPTPSKAGEFTQLLQTLSSSTPRSETQAGPPVASPVAPPVASAAAPGVFTQMFGSVSAPAASDPAVESHPTAAVPKYSPPAPQLEPKPPAVSAKSAPGDFTRMFQSITGANEAVPPANAPSESAPPLSTSQSSSGPGAFTQFFDSPSSARPPAADPLKSLRPEPPAPSPGTFSFQTPPSPPPEPSPIAQGGFTQLMNALNQDAPIREEALPKSPEPFMPPSPPASAASGPGMGSFTQLLNTLSADPAPQSAPRPAQPVSMPPAAPPAPPVSGAPGEFTRVISGDQLRGLQGPNIASGPPVLPSQQAAAPRPPLQFPSAPAFSGAPQVPAAHAPAAAPQPAMPHFQAPAFQFPPAPAPPAPPPPAPSKLQQYLPLILVLNIFVLLVIVVILIFVLRHH